MSHVEYFIVLRINVDDTSVTDELEFEELQSSS